MSIVKARVSKMKPRERFFNALDYAETDRVPAGVLGGGMWILRTMGYGFQDLIGRPSEMANVYLKANELIDSSVIYVGSGYNNLHIGALGGKIKYRRIGAPDLEEPLVKESTSELDDIDIDRLGGDAVVQTIWEAAERVADIVDDEYVVTMQCFGPLTLAGQIYGVERLMRSAYRSPQEIDKVIDFGARMVLRFYGPLIDKGVIQLATIADPTASGDLISRKHFERFALKPLQKVISALHAKGARVLLHICGDTTDKLDLLIYTGADCISLDQRVPLAEAKRVFTEKKRCLAGNVDPIHVLNVGTPEKVREECENALTIGASGGGFILVPGCDIPPTTPLENIQMLMKTAAEWRYDRA